MFDIHFHENPKIYKELNIIMTQIEELRDLLNQQNEVIVDETAEIKEKIDALEARIEELGGNQMPDITDLLDDVRTSIGKIESISDTEATTETGGTTETGTTGEVGPPTEEVPTDM